MKLDWNKAFIILGLAIPLLVILYMLVILGHEADPNIPRHPVPIGRY